MVIDTSVPVDSVAERKKAWAAFGAGPEWGKVRAESIAKHGQFSSVIQMSLWRATPYSRKREIGNVEVMC